MVDETSSWDLIELKKFKEACIKADEEYKSTNSVFHLRNKAIALLNLMKYDEVFNIASEIIKITNGKNDSDYIMAGIACWLQGKQKEAVDIWRDGLKTQYTDAAGGIEIPALMYYASVVSGDTNLEKEAISLLKKKYKSKAVANFPGSIAGYLLGKLSEPDLLNSYSSLPNLKTRILCKSYFYIAASYLKLNDKNSYYKNLEKCTANQTYLEKEYFLAIAELNKKG
jgi:lipoprotein NlpI